MSAVLTVTQLNRYIAFKLKEDKKLRGILIRGEISNFTNHAKTGHLYFTLKDGESAVRAVMFSNMASRLTFAPKAGMSVIVSADVKVYEQAGQYQLYVTDMQPDGIGALYLAIEQLKERLSAEGLFDEARKKPLPPFPQKIGIVTSVDAAALQDMLNIISRRYPVVRIEIFPCLVQGENAPASICRALAAADGSGQDIIIVGRGGGSVEDLMAFNSESVARRIAACNTPVISAVGRETDTTVADFAADLRAPTPSAAAELAVPQLSMLTGYLNTKEAALKEAMLDKIAHLRTALAIKEGTLNNAVPSRRVAASRSILDEKQRRLEAALKNRLVLCRSVVAEKTAALDNLSPLKIMNRGYSLVYKDNNIIRSASELKTGDSIEIRLADGGVSAIVE
ncbi:MAG: exodeoxyribonuclease VII large subunit [Oscillospiraceae bacterium]